MIITLLSIAVTVRIQYNTIYCYDGSVTVQAVSGKPLKLVYYTIKYLYEL